MTAAHADDEAEPRKDWVEGELASSSVGCPWPENSRRPVIKTFSTLRFFRPSRRRQPLFVSLLEMTLFNSVTDPRKSWIERMAEASVSACIVSRKLGDRDQMWPN